MAEDEKMELLRSRFASMDGELFLDCLALLDRVRPWIGSDAEVWSWFNTEVIASFGMTPAEVVKQCGAEGLKALNEYIAAKEAGGFE